MRTSIKHHKKEELPSFLQKLTERPDEVSIPSRPNKSVHHLGPVFFGCGQYHPPHHAIKIGGTHQVQYTTSSNENLLGGLFRTKQEPKKPPKSSKKVRLLRSRRKPFVDIYPHKSPGVRKIFKPEVSPRVIDFGESESIIEAEASQEIPIACMLKSWLSSPVTDYEIITPSDIRERRRKYMTYKELKAHAHYPKRFVTVRMIGPPIPAAITVTKLPSKRKTSFDITLETSTKENKLSKEILKIKDNNVESEFTTSEQTELQIPEDVFSVKDEKSSLNNVVNEESDEKVDSVSERDLSGIEEEEEDYEENHAEDEIEEIIEQNELEESAEEIIDEDTEE